MGVIRGSQWEMAACAAALLTLGGCVVADGGGNGLFGSGSRTVAYNCDDDRRMTVSYSDGGRRATVEAGDRTYRLRLRDRDGDRRYYEGDSDDRDLDLRVSNGRASFNVEGRDDYHGCRARG